VNTLQSGPNQPHRLDRHNLPGEIYARFFPDLKLMDHYSHQKN
jgi:hypothetical protein